MAATRESKTTRAFRPAPFFDHGLFLLHLNRGKEEMGSGHYETARREFEEARRLRPRDPEVLLDLSITLFPRPARRRRGDDARPSRRAR
jgi:Flp pilus assembly protein TadD